MSDFISRQEAIDAVHYYIESGYKCDIFQELKNLPTAEPEERTAKDAEMNSIVSVFSSEPMLSVKHYLENAPSLEGVTGVIRCENCKWWDRLEEGHPYGYCHACKSGTHTERWDISIYRQSRYDFYCADAEPKEDEVDDE